jgi:hypothetical protein
MKHTHHKIPRHMGGSDDPSNLVELTIEEHAEAHRLLYEQNGHWQDKVAWQGLLGLIPHEKIMEEMYEARKGEGNHMYGKPCYYKMTEEEKQQWKDNISKSTKGRKVSDETRKKMSENNGRSQLGKTPWNKGKTGVQPKSLETKMKISKPVVYKGIEYYSIEEAARVNNTTAYYITKKVKGINTPTRKCTTRNRKTTSK